MLRPYGGCHIPIDTNVTVCYTVRDALRYSFPYLNSYPATMRLLATQR